MNLKDLLVERITSRITGVHVRGVVANKEETLADLQQFPARLETLLPVCRAVAVTSSSSARLPSAGFSLDAGPRDRRRVAAAPCLDPSTLRPGGQGGGTRIRAMFLSDIHLGSRACQAARLLEFLRQYDCETIFLLGDIVDFWSLRRSVYWPSSHNTVVQKLLRLARRGAEIFYIPGNHDEALRDYFDASFGNIRVKKEHLHVAADGKRYALLHGDQYDQVTTCARWVSVLGDASYNLSWTSTRHCRGCGVSWA